MQIINAIEVNLYCELLTEFVRVTILMCYNNSTSRIANA